MIISGRSTIAFVATLFFVTSPSAFQIETRSQWDGAYSILYIGNPLQATATYGQTFKVTEIATIKSWTFWLSNQSGSPQPEVRIDGYLAEWLDDRTSSNMLYESIGRVVPISPIGEFHALEFLFPTIRLDPANTYIMFLNTSRYETARRPFELAALGSTSDLYTGGAFWYQASNNLFSNVHSFPWTCADEGNGCRYGDSAFTAIFTPVPELPSSALLLFGISFILLTRRVGV